MSWGVRRPLPNKRSAVERRPANAQIVGGTTDNWKRLRIKSEVGSRDPSAWLEVLQANSSCFALSPVIPVERANG